MRPIRSSCPARLAVPPCEAAKRRSSINSANGIRTRVWALRGPRPSPLDDSAATTTTFHYGRSRGTSQPPSIPQARRESNPQPPVLETGALPIELRTYSGQIPPNFTTNTRCKSLQTADTANCGQLGSERRSEVVLKGVADGN